MPVLVCNDVVKRFPIRGAWRSHWVTVVNHVSLTVPESQVLCIVGESGCGKTTLGKMLAGVQPATEGSIFVDGTLLYNPHASTWERDALKVQIVHQDPFSTLNPVHTIREEISLPLLHHRIVSKAEVRNECERLLTITGLDPRNVLDKYPHELSGGQRQRAVLARALSVRPKYLVADEAVPMVDVSSRLIMLDLFMEIAQSQKLGLVFITHDFGVARYVAYEGQIAVMYLGRIVEYGPTEQVIHQPQHPYTQVLLSSIPVLQAGVDFMPNKVLPRSFEVPSLEHLPPGCVFESRCPFAYGPCSAAMPSLDAVPGVRDHRAACYLVEDRRTGTA